MPEPPEGEAALRQLAFEFGKAEGYVGVLLAEAVVGNRTTKTAADGVRTSFAKVNRDNLEELLEHPTTAAVDRSGNHWSLGAWAEVHCTTYGRQASSRGLTDALVTEAVS